MSFFSQICSLTHSCCAQPHGLSSRHCWFSHSSVPQSSPGSSASFELTSLRSLRAHELNKFTWSKELLRRPSRLVVDWSVVATNAGLEHTGASSAHTDAHSCDSARHIAHCTKRKSQATLTHSTQLLILARLPCTQGKQLQTHTLDSASHMERNQPRRH